MAAVDATSSRNSAGESSDDSDSAGGTSLGWLLGSGRKLWQEDEVDEETSTWQDDSIPLSELPALNSRGFGFWTEPWLGIFFVGGMCALLVGMTLSVTQDLPAGHRWRTLPQAFICTFSGIAILCVTYILLAFPSNIPRNATTCYPIPVEVLERLKEGRALKGMNNIPCPQKTRGTYCPRCCVWRPNSGKSNRAHHCSTCQRCVTGFDHHCGVFGRCIVKGNMPCFVVLIAMLPCGMVTAMASVVLATANETESDSLRLL